MSRLWAAWDADFSGGGRNRSSRVLTPADLCEVRGLDQSDIAGDVIFRDRLLGYVIFEELDDSQPTRSGGQDRGSAVKNFEIGLASEKDSAHPDVPGRWYVKQLDGWSKYTGARQKVAVMDSGVAHDVGALPRHPCHADFCGCEKPGMDTGDLEGHGTKCAGLIGATADKKGRRAVAPDSQVIVAQIVRKGAPLVTTLVDLLLMLSWCVHRWNTRVISMSFSATLHDEGARPDLLGRIAERLRWLDRALIFCAADDRLGFMAYPATARGVVAIGGYVMKDGTLPDGGIPIQTDIMIRLSNWTGLRDLFFAPASKLATVRRDGSDFERFGDASGACAFAAGVASLYMEANPGLTANGIVRLMRDDSVPVVNPTFPTVIWRAIRLPRNPAPCYFGAIGRAIYGYFVLVRRTLLSWWVERYG